MLCTFGWDTIDDAVKVLKKKRIPSVGCEAL